jgi:hypothetical protein
MGKVMPRQEDRGQFPGRFLEVPIVSEGNTQARKGSFCVARLDLCDHVAKMPGHGRFRPGEHRVNFREHGWTTAGQLGFDERKGLRVVVPEKTNQGIALVSHGIPFYAAARKRPRGTTIWLKRIPCEIATSRCERGDE